MRCNIPPLQSSPERSGVGSTVSTPRFPASILLAPRGQKTADSLRGRLQGSDSFKVEVRCVSHSYILHLHYIWFLVGKDRTTDPRVGCARSSRAVRERGTPAPAASCCRPEACREGCSGSGLVGDACAHQHPARRNDGVNDDRFAHVARPREHQASLRHEPGRWRSRRSRTTAPEQSRYSGNQ